MPVAIDAFEAAGVGDKELRAAGCDVEELGSELGIGGDGDALGATGDKVFIAFC